MFLGFKVSAFHLPFIWMKGEKHMLTFISKAPMTCDCMTSWVKNLPHKLIAQGSNATIFSRKREMYYFERKGKKVAV